MACKVNAPAWANRVTVRMCSHEAELLRWNCEMRIRTSHFLLYAAVQCLNAQDSRDFSGIWQLNPARSQIRDFSSPPARMLNVEKSTVAVTVSASMEPGVPSSTFVCPLDGKPRKSQVNATTWNVVSKWEGDALLMNIIVSGPPAEYSLFERWSRSRDRSQLTITRNVTRPGGETESIFVYDSGVAIQPISPGGTARALEPPVTLSRESPAPPTMRFRPVENPPEAAPGTEYVVRAGTRILMQLTNPVNTKHTAAGDRVYLQTAVPVFVNSRLIIPVGSYVTGTVTESQRAGRLKGRSSLNLRFESVTLPNGVTRDFLGRAGSADTQGSLDRTEGRIQGGGRSGPNARTVAQTTSVGAGIGSIGGVAGLGIGAAAGAAAGLAGVFGSRRADVVIPRGTSIELVLDRDLTFGSADLRPGLY
jgi:hypothetical protein